MRSLRLAFSLQLIAIAAFAQGTGTINGVPNQTLASVTNGSLSNASTTVNGQTCTLGSTCNVNSGAANHSVSVNAASGNAIGGVALANLAILSGVTGADPAGKSFSDLNATDYIAGGGTAQAQTATLAPAATALTTGLTLYFKPNAANTGAAPTLAVNGLTATAITKCGTTALVANDLITAAVAEVIYDGTQFQLFNPQSGACGSAGGSVTAVNGTSNQIASTGGTTPVISLATAIILPGNMAHKSTTVSFSATPNFDLSLSDIFTITLTGNVTGATVSNHSNGLEPIIKVCQNGTGNFTFVWPATMLGHPDIGLTASKCTVVSFLDDGTNSYATGISVINM